MTKSIQARVSDQTVEAIRIAIEIGYAKSLADFAEKAIVSKLLELGIFYEKIKVVMKD